MFTADFIPITLKISETVKAVTVAFCSIQWIFIRDICAKFGIPNLSQSPDIEQNSDGGFSDFFISGQSLTNANCHNSGTSNDIVAKNTNFLQKNADISKIKRFLVLKDIFFEIYEW